MASSARAVTRTTTAAASAASTSRCSLHRVATSQQCLAMGRVRGFHAAVRRREESKGKDKSEDETSARRTFRGQLYESTLMRLERERQQQDQMAAERAQMESSGQRAARLGVAMLVVAAIAYYMGTRTPSPLPTTSTIPLAQAKRPEHDTDKRTLEALWADFVQVVGKENVSTETSDLEGHMSSDWSSYQGTKDMKPFLIVYPNSTEEVSKIMKACHARRVPVTAFSGGTSLEGHVVPTKGGVTVDFSRMNRILALHKEDLDVVVQPAVGWEELNEELAQEGLFFPPDPGPGAMIGGMVGTGCSGTNAFRYGTMKEWVASLTVVLADGTVVKTRQRPRKSSAGYDLTRLFIGSEGTLGLVTEATLQLTAKPRHQRVAVATFASVRDAAQCVFQIVDSGVQIAAMELLDDVQMRCINESGSTTRSWKEAQTLLLKFNGSSPAGVKEQIGIVQKLARAAKSQSFEFAQTDAEAAELWSARKEALWSLMAKRRAGDHVWVTDVAVPISKLPDIVDRTKEDIRQSGLTGSIVGHVGDGNFHAILLFNDTERPIVEHVIHDMVKRAVELEGTVTGEHGVGVTKRDYLPHALGQTTVDAMRKLKQAFDPLCLLNCDKIIRSQTPAKGEVKPW